MQKSPFKFLDSYTKEDRDIFFGRNKEIEELHSRVFESKILVVYGISGTGKSSLIFCGLANKFNDSDWLPIGIRRGININQSLIEGLLRNTFDEKSSEKATSTSNKKNDIVKIIRSIYLDHFKPVYLIFDQFEELFIFGTKEEKEEFIANISRIFDSDLQCRLIFSIREEYLAGITEFERIIPSFLTNRIRIEKMTRQNAVEVIEGPCRINNIQIEPGFSESLLDKLNPNSPEVELTYLQVYLDKIFRLASPDGRDVQKITNDLLLKAGDVKDLLGSFLEEQIAKLDDPDSGLVILKSFVSVKGTKHSITEEEVIEYSRTFGKDIDREHVKSLIQKFIGLRILRDKDQNGRYELRHDSLATKIYEKITLVEKELLEIRQFIENAYNNFEKRRLFLTADDLTYIAPYEDKLFLNDRIQKFISQSKYEIHKARRRRQNALIAFTIVIFSVLSFFTIWALRERSNALDQKKFADEQRNSAIIAKTLADSASLLAERSKNLAVEKEAQAVLSQKQSELASKEALAQKAYALAQKSIAEKLSVEANNQARIANAEKLIAEQEKAKAMEAESRTRQLSLLSTAQNLALKSSAYEKTPVIMGLLAVQAFNFNKENGGKSNEPIIREALYTAWESLDSSRHSLFTGSINEIRSISYKGNNLITADLEGQLRQWSWEGRSTDIGKLQSKSPINFIQIGSKGEKVITQNEEQKLILWDLNTADKKAITGEDINGSVGLVNSVAFSRGDKYMTAGGSDSTIIVWDISVQPALKIKTIKTQSPVKAIAFCNADSIVFAQDDGSVSLWNIEQSFAITLYKSINYRPLCLGWNNARKMLFIGCSNGILLSIDLNSDKFWVAENPIHSSGIDHIVFNSDYSQFATTSWDKTIKLFNYHDFIDLGNTVGGVVHLKNIFNRSRALSFSKDGKLVASTSDRNLRIWETSSDKLALMICNLINRDMTVAEWSNLVGMEIPYEKTCGKNP